MSKAMNKVFSLFRKNIFLPDWVTLRWLKLDDISCLVNRQNHSRLVLKNRQRNLTCTIAQLQSLQHEMSDFQGIAERLGGFRRVLLCEFRHCTSHVINYWVTNLAAICLERCVHVAECNRRNFVTVLRPVTMESPSISAFVVSERMGATDAERSLSGVGRSWVVEWRVSEDAALQRACRRANDRELPQLIDDDAVQSCPTRRLHS